MKQNCFNKLRCTAVLVFALLILSGTGSVFAGGAQESTEEKPALVVINMADTHSAYDTYSKILWKVKELKTEYQDSELVILFDGDLFESGNIVAKKSKGMVDLEFLKHLGECGKVIINVGNHEFDLMSPKDFLSTAEAAGAVVIGNVTAEDMPETAVYTDITAAEKTIRVIGVGVDAKNTYPKPLRESISIPEPVKWLKANYPKLSSEADYVIVASHAGLVPDLAMLDVVGGAPSLLYMVGAHDHIILHENVNGTIYMHNGFKGERFNIAEIFIDNDDAEVVYKDIMTKDIDGIDEEMAAAVKAAEDENLGSEDLQIVGTVENDLSILEAALWSVEMLKKKTGADAAFLNHTSFGSGLKKGPLPKYLFDQFMRFDNDVMVAEVDSETLKAIIAVCNQQDQSDLYKRSGDFLYTGDIDIEDGKLYKIATSSWVALDFNQPRYLGQSIKFEKLPDLKTKGILTEAMSK